VKQDLLLRLRRSGFIVIFFFSIYGAPSYLQERAGNFGSHSLEAVERTTSSWCQKRPCWLPSYPQHDWSYAIEGQSKASTNAACFAKVMWFDAWSYSCRQALSRCKSIHSETFRTVEYFESSITSPFSAPTDFHDHRNPQRTTVSSPRNSIIFLGRRYLQCLVLSRSLHMLRNSFMHRVEEQSSSEAFVNSSQPTKIRMDCPKGRQITWPVESYNLEECSKISMHFI
jgi:hypothetical protein